MPPTQDAALSVSNNRRSNANNNGPSVGAADSGVGGGGADGEDQGVTDEVVTYKDEGENEGDNANVDNGDMTQTSDIMADIKNSLVNETNAASNSNDLQNNPSMGVLDWKRLNELGGLTSLAAAFSTNGGPQGSGLGLPFNPYSALPPPLLSYPHLSAASKYFNPFNPAGALSGLQIPPPTPGVVSKGGLNGNDGAATTLPSSSTASSSVRPGAASANNHGIPPGGVPSSASYNNNNNTAATAAAAVSAAQVLSNWAAAVSPQNARLPLPTTGLTPNTFSGLNSLHGGANNGATHPSMSAANPSSPLAMFAHMFNNGRNGVSTGYPRNMFSNPMDSSSNPGGGLSNLLPQHPFLSQHGGNPNGANGSNEAAVLAAAAAATAAAVNQNGRIPGVGVQNSSSSMGPHHPHSNHSHSNNDLIDQSQGKEKAAMKPPKPYVKKPLNAFMLFMKENREKVMQNSTLKESAAINQILGREWHRLEKSEQNRYYEMAKSERLAHQRLHPSWTARDNYATSKQRKRRKRNMPAGYCNGDSPPSQEDSMQNSREMMSDFQNGFPGSIDAFPNLTADQAAALMMEGKPLPGQNLFTGIMQRGPHGIISTGSGPEFDNRGQGHGHGQLEQSINGASSSQNIITLSNQQQPQQQGGTSNKNNNNNNVNNNNSNTTPTHNQDSANTSSESIDPPESASKKCRARFGLEQQDSWCKHCRRKKKCSVFTGGANDEISSSAEKSSNTNKDKQRSSSTMPAKQLKLTNAPTVKISSSPAVAEEDNSRGDESRSPGSGISGYSTMDSMTSTKLELLNSIMESSRQKPNIIDLDYTVPIKRVRNEEPKNDEARREDLLEARNVNCAESAIENNIPIPLTTLIKSESSRKKHPSKKDDVHTAHGEGQSDGDVEGTGECSEGEDCIAAASKATTPNSSTTSTSTKIKGCDKVLELLKTSPVGSNANWAASLGVGIGSDHGNVINKLLSPLSLQGQLMSSNLNYNINNNHINSSATADNISNATSFITSMLQSSIANSLSGNSLQYPPPSDSNNHLSSLQHQTQRDQPLTPTAEPNRSTFHQSPSPSRLKAECLSPLIDMNLPVSTSSSSSAAVAAAAAAAVVNNSIASQFGAIFRNSSSNNNNDLNGSSLSPPEVSASTPNSLILNNDLCSPFYTMAAAANGLKSGATHLPFTFPTFGQTSSFSNSTTPNSPFSPLQPSSAALAAAASAFSAGNLFAAVSGANGCASVPGANAQQSPIPFSLFNPHPGFPGDMAASFSNFRDANKGMMAASMALSSPGNVASAAATASKT